MASIILMFTMFLMEMFSASNSKDSNIVVERWGFMLEKEGIPLGLYSSIDKVSLEIAISKPVVKIPDDVGKAYRVAAETKKRYPNYKAGEEAEICYHMWNVSVVALMSRVDEAESAISDFQELTGDIASLASGESSGRKKRSTLGDLGEIADTVVGYTGSILGLENDSKEADVAAYIRNEVPKIKKGFKKQIKVSGMIVREETEMAEKINELISDVNCRSAAKDYYLLMKDECDTYLSDVKIFTEDYTILGLPESVIDKSMLIRMIRSHPAFNGTIFVKRPSLLRQYSELSTRRVINQNTSLHIFFALTFPILKESDMLPRYSVHQTGISNNGSCHELLLPDTVVLKEDKWYEVRCHGPIKGICPVHEGTTKSLSFKI